MLEKLTAKCNELTTEMNTLSGQISQLSKTNIPLSSDPVAEGLSTLNSRISDIQKSKDLVCQMALQVLTAKTIAENMNTSIEGYVKKRKNEIMEKDPDHYNGLKSQALRDIALEKPLEEEMKLVSKISQLVTIFKSYYAAVQLQLNNLDSTNNNLKKQLDVIENMISIGEIETKHSKGGIQ
jgi:outer membrane murein-binding lipoprotein Lpp